MIADMNSLPLWKCLDVTSGRPSLDSMVALLERNAFKAPRSGSACVQLIWENRTTITCDPPPPDHPPPDHPPPDPSIPPPIPLPISEPPPGPSEPEIPIIPEIPLIDQCENGIRSEAEERLKTCLESSFKTDNGRIMLENDLLLFDNSEEWIQEMIREWHPRLKSTVREEFSEAIHLWMLSQPIPSSSQSE